jgi:hypothetical protein
LFEPSNYLPLQLQIGELTMRIFYSAVMALVLAFGLLAVPNAFAGDNDESSFRGCLAGTDDNYVLRDEASGKLYRLHSDKDLDEHVGNIVEVRGNIDNNHREREAQVQANAASQAGIEIPSAGINVDDLKTVSKGCGEMQQQAQPAQPEQSTQPAQPEQPVQPQQ